MATAQEMAIMIRASGGSSAASEFGKVTSGANAAAAGVGTATATINRHLASIEASARVAAAGTVAQFAQMGAQIAQKIAQSTVGAGVGFNVMAEQAKIAFTQMLGSGEKAEAMLRDLQKLAIDSPLELPQARQGAQTLLAMGFSGDKVIPIMRTLTDAASAFGGNMGDRIDHITLALGQMANSVHVNAQDMNQLIQSGIPAWNALAEAMHKSVGQVRDDAEKGLITGPQAVNAVLTYIEGHMGGLAAKQGQTLGGLFASMHDLFKQAAGGLIEPFTDRLRDSLQGIVAGAQGGDFQAKLKGIVDGINNTLSMVGNISSDHGMNLLDASLTTISIKLKEAFGPGASGTFDRITGLLGDTASMAGTAAKAVWDLSQKFAAASVNGSSFADGLGPVGTILDGIRGALERIGPHKEVLAGLVAAFVGFQILSTVIPIVLGAAAAIEALFAAFAVGGAAAGASAIITLLGGPLVIALGAVALATGTLAAAWVGNWGDIQTKTAVAVKFIQEKFDELGSAANKLPGLIGGKFDEIGTRISASLPVTAAAVDAIRAKIGEAMGRGPEQAPGTETSTQQHAYDTMQAALSKLDPSQTTEAIAIITKAWADLPQSMQGPAQEYAAQLAQIEIASNNAANRGRLSFAGLLVALQDLAHGTTGSVDSIVADLKRIGDERVRQEAIAATAAASRAANAGFTDKQRAKWGANLDTQENKDALENARAAAEANAYYWAHQPTGGAPQIDTGPGGDDTKSKAKHVAETAIEGFMAALSANEANFKAAFSDLGAKAASALSTAFAKNEGGGGSSAARALEDMVDKLRTMGIADWRALGDDLAGAFHDALLYRTEETKAAALAKLAEVDAILKRADIFDVANLQTQISKSSNLGGGASLMESLETAVREGGAKVIAQVASAAVGMRDSLVNGFPLEVAERWATDVFAGIARVAEEKSQDAMDSLRGLLTFIATQGPAIKARLDADIKINAATEDTGIAIGKLNQGADEQIDKLHTELAINREIRAEREALTDIQQKALDDMEALNAGMALNQQRLRENVTERIAGERQVAEAIKGFADSAEDRLISRARQMADIRRNNQPRGTVVPGVGTISGAQLSPITEAIRHNREEDEDIARREGRQMSALRERIALAHSDRVEARANQDADAFDALGRTRALHALRLEQRGEIHALDERLENAAIARQEADIRDKLGRAIGELNTRLTDLITVQNTGVQEVVNKYDLMNSLQLTLEQSWGRTADYAERVAKAMDPSKGGPAKPVGVEDMDFGGGSGGSGGKSGGGGKGNDKKGGEPGGIAPGNVIHLTYNQHAPVYGVSGGGREVAEFLMGEMAQVIEGSATTTGSV